MFSPFHKTFLALTSWLIALLVALVVSMFSSTVAQAAPFAQSTGQNLHVIDRRGGQTTDVVVDGIYAYTIVGTRLVVLDVSNPATPSEVGGLDLNYAVYEMAIADDFLYLASGNLIIISISDPLHPVEVGQFYSSSYMLHIAAQGHYAYIPVVRGDPLTFQLQVVDIAKPASPTQVGEYSYPLSDFLSPPFIALQGNFVYLLATINRPEEGENQSAEGDLRIIDISNPHNPILVSRLDLPNQYYSNLKVVGDTVYVSGYTYLSDNLGVSFSNGLQIVDISNPFDPKLKGRIVSPRTELLGKMAVAGDYLYWGGVYLPGIGPVIGDVREDDEVAGDYIYWGRVYGGGPNVFVMSQQVEVINVADREHPVLEKPLDFNSLSLFSAENLLYNASPNNGLQIFNLSTPLTPTLINGNNNLEYGTVEEILRQNNLLYTTGGGRLKVRDLSTPTLDTISSLATYGRLLAIDNNKAYLSWNAYSYQTNYCYGFQAVDITNPLSLTATFSYRLGCSYTNWDDPLQIHTFTNQRLYASSNDDKLYVFDVATAITPTLLGTYKPMGSTMVVKGNYAYLANMPTGITILDVSAATTPTFVSSYSAIEAVQRLAISDHYLFATTYGGQLYILDIANPTTPLEVGRIAFVQFLNLAVEGNYLYVADFTRGLLVFDISDPAKPLEVAFNTEVAFQTGLEYSHIIVTADQKLYAGTGTNGLLTLQLSGSMAGKVVDPLGKPYAGVRVTLNSNQTIETNGQGTYSFSSLTPGEYTVTVESPIYDFHPTERTLRVPSYSSTSLNFTPVPKPLTIAITPAAPANLSFTDLQGNMINVNLPAGSVNQSTNLSLVPEISASAPGQFFTGVRFNLQATQAGNFSFTLPITVTIHYTDSEIAPVSDKNQLALYWWDSKQWVAATTTCSSAIPAQLDLENRQISTAICQTGQFALFGPTEQSFLPLIAGATFAPAILRGRFVAKHSGKCLNVLAESQANGTNVIQWHCSNADNETWIVQPQGEYFQIVAKHSRKCLNINGASQAEGAQVIQWSCTGGDNELWHLRSVSAQTYQIVAKHSNQCLTLQDAAKDDLAQAVQAKCSSGDHQLWQFQPAI